LLALALGSTPVAADVDVTVVATPEAEKAAAPSCPAGEEPQRLAVFVTPPEGSSITTAVFDIDYDEKRVALPGVRFEDSVRNRFHGFPEGSVNAINDKDDSVRVVVTGTKSLSRKLALFTVEFDVCQGATEPAIADYSCTIASCVATTVPVDGCTCRIEFEAR
jgi:hypothetical protein